MVLTPREVAACIDHTLLRPEATTNEVEAAAQLARNLRVAALCISPSFVPLAARALSGSEVRVCTVIGFPSGAHQTAIKVYEAGRAVDDGAHELDMVIHRGLAAAGEWDAVRDDIAAVVKAADGRCVKVILETAALEPAAIDQACKAAMDAGSAFVKTSTGFGPGGATVEAVTRMRAAVGERLGVKASGGIRDGAKALAMLEAGANRLGASATEHILATLPVEPTS